MSQFWHAHWAEDGFKPTKLRNWEVPRWHAQWPDNHTTSTQFQAHTNGRLFANVKRSGCPWGDYKGTWELPSKIDRKTAEELSRSTEYKKAFWDIHKKKHDRLNEMTRKCRSCQKKTISCPKNCITDEKDTEETNDHKLKEKKIDTRAVTKAPPPKQCYIKDLCIL
ncbi:hypothetical protein TKK_0012013 [Trichogramma kaykai]